MMITVIGRGHSGTRAMSHTLSASGVYMGDKTNCAGDLVPASDLYEACRIMSRHVKYLGDMRWDFKKLHTMPIDPAFTRLVESYLASVLASDAERKGWKLPENTLIFPWLVRMFPDIYYIYWIRDPRDCILGRHLTDDLAAFGVPHDRTEDTRMRRAMSWKYQVELVRATPRPKHFITIRFEDFVLRQENTLRQLETYLGFSLEQIPVGAEAVGRWRRAPHNLSFLRSDLLAHGYTVD
jgi:hypothetical protein